jgi:MlaD protein
MRGATWVLGSLLLVSCREVVSSDGPAGDAVLDDARGLAVAADVMVAGVRVGKVESVELVDGKAHVKFTAAAGDLVAKGACAEVARYSLESRAHLELRRGGAAGAPIGSCATTSVDDVTGASLRAVDAVTALLDEARTGKGIVARLLRDEALAKELERALGRECGPTAPETPATPPTAVPKDDAPPAPPPRPAPPVPPKAQPRLETPF